MRLKSGVRVVGLQPQMVLALIIAEGIYSTHKVELVVTSGVEGKHSETSRHYLGLAVDIRTRDFSSTSIIHEVVLALRHALGDDFYVAFETNHIHISFKPKALTA